MYIEEKICQVSVTCISTRGNCLSHFSLVRPYTLYEKKILRTHVNIKLIETTKALHHSIRSACNRDIQGCRITYTFTLCMLDICICMYRRWHVGSFAKRPSRDGEAFITPTDATTDIEPRRDDPYRAIGIRLCIPLHRKRCMHASPASGSR